MPLITLNPNANSGVYDAWTLLGAAGTKQAALADTTDGNYIWHAANAAGFDTVKMESLPSTAVDINSVAGRWRLGRQAAGAGLRGLFVNSSGGVAVYATGESFANAFPANWTNIGYTNIPTAPGGGAWTVADVNDIEMGIGQDGSGGAGNRSHCTKMELRVDYVPAAGGFAFLIAQYILPLLGSAIPFSAMREIAREVVRAGGPLIKPEEYRIAWGELR
jgi:hypothetical protein